MVYCQGSEENRESAPNNNSKFARHNRGFNQTFCFGRMSLGLVVPIESYPSTAIPCLTQHVAKVKLAETLGFKAVWLRDIPFNVPSFGDVGQQFDPFVYLGALSMQTQCISLGVASLILPLRHPAHVAKSACSVDQLSAGRLILGVASGDRADEYPAMAKIHQDRGQDFREAFQYIETLQDPYPKLVNKFGMLDGNLDLLPKPFEQSIPMLVTGHSQQSKQWLARHSHGMITYPREPQLQRSVISDWNNNVEHAEMLPKPVMQPLYLDLLKDPDAPIRPIPLGVQCGIHALLDYLLLLQSIGVNHIALNLRFNQRDIDTTLTELADQVLPFFA